MNLLDVDGLQPNTSYHRTKFGELEEFQSNRSIRVIDASGVVLIEYVWSDDISAPTSGWSEINNGDSVLTGRVEVQDTFAYSEWDV